MNKLTNIIIVAIVLMIIGSFLADQGSSVNGQTSELKYSEFMNRVTDGGVKSVMIDEGEFVIKGEDITNAIKITIKVFKTN